MYIIAVGHVNTGAQMQIALGRDTHLHEHIASVVFVDHFIEPLDLSPPLCQICETRVLIVLESSWVLVKARGRPNFLALNQMRFQARVPVNVLNCSCKPQALEPLVLTADNCSRYKYDIADSKK